MHCNCIFVTGVAYLSLYFLLCFYVLCFYVFLLYFVYDFIINIKIYWWLLLLHCIVISRSELCDHDWSDARHVICENIQCCQVSSVQCHVPGEHGSCDPCFGGTWHKLCHTMRLCRFSGLTAILGRSIRILCCCIVDNNTNLLHIYFVIYLTCLLYTSPSPRD